MDSDNQPLSAEPIHGVPVLLTNREFTPPADGWHQIVPIGEWPIHVQRAGGRRERLVQVIDAPALDAMVRNFNREILIDYEHFSHDLSKPTTAAGWIQEVQRRADGLYARNRWSARGKADIEGGTYRYISAEFSGSDLEQLGEGRVRPRALTGAGLTNRPNIPTTPLSNRSPQGGSTQDENMINIANALGLGQEATEDTICAKITELRGSQTTLQNRCTELEGTVQRLQTEQVDADLAAFADVIGEDKESAKTMLLANRAATVALFTAQRGRLAAKSPAAPVTLTNRQQPGNPGIEAGGKPLAERQAAAVESIRLQNRCSFAEAWAQARREKPELFAEEKSPTA
jgi:phage I-like protein